MMHSNRLCHHLPHELSIAVISVCGILDVNPVHDPLNRRQRLMSANRTKTPWRLLGLGLLLGAIILLGFNGRQWWPIVEQMVQDGGIKGFALFMASFIALTSLCFPVSALGFTAGVIFGPWIGLLLIFPSGLLSGSLMFFLGRTLLRGFVQDLVRRNAKLSAIENVAGDQALRLNILTRLSPFNFGLASYALAVGKSPFKAYILGTAASLPSMMAQVWVGSLAGETGKMAKNGLTDSPLKIVLLTVGVLFFLLLTWQVSRMVRQALSSENSTENE